MALILGGDGTITGNPDITLTESVSIAGTITYEDVTNIDSVGVITARSGINVGPTSGIGITLNANGSASFAGRISSGAEDLVNYGLVAKNISDNLPTLYARNYSTNSNALVFSGFDETSSTVPTSTIGSDGSATFKAPTANGVEVQTVGGNEGTKFPFVGKNTSGTITFKVNGDGTVQSGGDPASGAAQGTKMGYWGGFNACRTTASNSVFVGYTEGNASATVDILANGKATFAAGAFAIESDGDISTNVRCHGHIELDSTGAFTSPKIKLFSNTGNATFVGNLTANAKVLGTGTSGTGKVVGYQQGTWTPVYAEAGNNNNEATDYSNRLGYWWRVGNIVTVSVTLNMASNAGISPNNGLVIKDFPYVCQNVSTYYGSSSSVHANGWTLNTTVFVNVLIPSNTTKADLYYATSSQSGNYDDVDYSKIGTGSLIFNMSYLTDDTTWTPVNGASVAS